MKIPLPPPQHWYSNPQNSNWPQNVRPPSVPYYPPEPKLLQLFPDWVQKDHHRVPGLQETPKHNKQQYKHHIQSKVEQTHNQKEPKAETKKCTAFVPLQAQKKSRHITAKQAVSKDSANQSAKDKPQPTVQQKGKESPAKVCYQYFLKQYLFSNNYKYSFLY